MTQIRFDRVSPDLLEKNPWNSNHVSPENQARISKSIDRLGFFKPIVVREYNGKYQIIGGEHRWIAAKEKGLTEVPILNLGKISDEKAKEVGIADNARYGADDITQLGKIFEELNVTSDEIQEFLPYSSAELDVLINPEDDLDVDAIFGEDIDEDDKFDLAEENTKVTTDNMTILRFKVTKHDAQKIEQLLSKTKTTLGLEKGDSLQTSGYALSHLLLGNNE